ncbi:MAG: hypothetical protein RL375_2811 [Pseudomonadota bacterium]
MPEQIDSGGRGAAADVGDSVAPRRRLGALWGRWLPADDLLRQPAYLRIWVSVLISSLGGQVTMLALPLTAALLLSATPTQMGWLTAMETLPFVLFSLPAGVWLDRVAKLPVYLAGELILCGAVLSVPLAWWIGGKAWLGMGWLYAVAFVIGTVSTVAGSAGQIVLTQVVGRDRLVEAFARNALAASGAEVAGPGLAGLLIKSMGAPLALLVDAVMLLASALVLRGVPVVERVPVPSLRTRAASGQVGTVASQALSPSRQRARRRRLRWLHLRREARGFGTELVAGLRFVLGHQLLVQLAMLAGLWQFCYHSAMVVQILYATRSLGLSEQGVGLSYIAVGVGSVLGSLSGSAVSKRLGPGPAMLLGQALTGAGWLVAVTMSPDRVGHTLAVAAFVLMLLAFATGATWVFVNFISLRQAVTPSPLLGRMTTTMRWLILIPAAPGAMLGGWLGEHIGLGAGLAFGGVTLLVGLALAWRYSAVAKVLELPQHDDHEASLGAEAAPGAIPAAT